MKTNRVKIVSVAAVLTVLGTLAVPTNAAAARCSTERARELSDRPPIQITNRATKTDPIVVRYDQPQNAVFMGPGETAGEVKFALQMSSGHRVPRLHVSLEWPTPSVSDIDAYLYDSAGEEVARAEHWNVSPVEEMLGANGGSGYEYFATHVGRCSTYQLMTDTWHSPGEKVTMKIWLTPGR